MAKDEHDNTPLHLAAFHGQLQAFNLHIDCLGCDPNFKGQFGWRPLCMASKSGNLKLVRYLVEDHNCSPSIGEESPLLIAEKIGNYDIVMYFIEKFPCILDLNRFSEINSGMQDLLIDSSTLPTERFDQSKHHYNGEDMSSILYEVTAAKNNTSNPLITEKKHTENTFRDELFKYMQQ